MSDPWRLDDPGTNAKGQHVADLYLGQRMVGYLVLDDPQDWTEVCAALQAPGDGECNA